jgi:small-conductance mechanosensitive channel
MSDDVEDQYGKDFKYEKPLPKYSENEKKLLETNKELTKKVSLLEGNMKAMNNDNRTLRKHMLSQTKELQAVKRDQDRATHEIRRLYSIIESMIEQDNKRSG